MHYVQPECDLELGVAHGVQPVKLKHELEALASDGKQVGAVLMVSPTYFGACSDLTGQLPSLQFCPMDCARLNGDCSKAI